MIGDVPEPEPGPEEVRIAVGGVGLCGSDLAVFSGKWTAPAYPWILGHEAFGTVEAVGDRCPDAGSGTSSWSSRTCRARVPAVRARSDIGMRSGANPSA